MLGILGLGSYSSLHYIKRLNEEFQKRKGGYSTLPFKMLNVDFNEINPYLPNQFDKLIPIVKNKIEELNQLEVSKILIPNITIHQTIDQINLAQEIKDKFVHPITILGKQKDKTEQNDNIILASYYTMNSTYISEQVAGRVTKLPETEMKMIDQWRQDIYKNGVTPKIQTAYKAWYKKHSHENIIVACTELSILLNHVGNSANIIDLAELQILNSL